MKRKIFKYTGFGFIPVAITLIVVFVLSLGGVRIYATPTMLSLDVKVTSGIGLADVYTGSLDIKFEPSGTHIDSNGNLKIRLDFYPREGSKSYAINYVQVADENSKEYLTGFQGKVDEFGSPVNPDEYQKWLDSVPKIWQLNPCLSHFLTVKPDITLAGLQEILNGTFTANVTATIDDAMIQTESAHLISPYMRDKTTTTAVKMWDDTIAMTPILTDLSSKGAIEPTKATLVTAKTDPTTKLKVEDSIVADLNTRLASLSVGGKTVGISEVITPQSIDVGSPASDRTATLSPTYTMVNQNNPANDTGTLDTVEIWFENTLGSGDNCDVATFYVVSGNNLTSRDIASLGSVTQGSKQTFSGLSIAVSSGDYLGKYSSTGYIERDGTGVGYWYVSGDKLPCTNQAFSSTANRIPSLYATGATAGTYNLTNDPSSKDFGIVAASSTIQAGGGAYSNPVQDGECTFTITNSQANAIKVSIKESNPTGGVGWTLTASAPGENTIRDTAVVSGVNPASGIVLTTSDQTLIASLAGSATKKWDLQRETGTFTDGAQKSSTITLTGSAP
jgi:hypothetical protein